MSSETVLVELPTIQLFGMTLHALRMEDAVGQILRWSEDDRAADCRYVVTPNVNHAVLRRRHPAFAKAYLEADLVLADGAPIVLASRMFRCDLPERVAGSDLVPTLFDHVRPSRPLRTYLFGAMPEINERAARCIEERWPAVRIVGRQSPPLGFERDAAQTRFALDDIASSGAELLIVGLGAPKQELWVNMHRHDLRARVALCVGATIDFLAGEKPRAPVWMRRSGLEWLHRVATEPRRLAGRYVRDGLALPGLVWDEWRNARTRQSG